MVTYQMNIELASAKTLYTDMEFVSGDTGTYTLRIRFTNRGTPAEFDGKLFTVRAKRADGKILTDAGKIKDGICSYTLKNSMYAVPGELILELAVSDSAGAYVTAKILYARVIEGMGEGTLATENTNVYVTLLAQMNEQLSSAKELMEGGRAYLNEAKQQADEAKKQIDEAKKQIDEAKKQADAIKEQREDLKQHTANALTETVSGESVFVSDISPVEHGVKVKATSDTVTDLSTVTVNAAGKNLCDGMLELGNIGMDNGAEGVATIQKRTINYIPVKPNTTYVISREDLAGKIYTRFYDKDKNYLGYFFSAVPSPSTFTTKENCYFLRLMFGGDMDLTEKVQVELGDTATEYEPYSELAGSYELSADGTAEGIKSIYPNMTLIPDTEGVRVEAEYNKDLNKVIEKLINAIISLGGNI